MVAAAQFGNEWIHFDQAYAKVPTAREGFYKVSFAQLQSAGISTSDPDKLQVFHRGIEQSILVGTDYLEFFGRRNDGTLDRELYLQQANQPHLYYNIFSDSTFYFITSGTSTGKRIVLNDPPAEGSVITYVNSEKILILNSSYSTGVDYGNIIHTAFDKGEGWMGPVVASGQAMTSHTLSGITDGVAAAGKPVLEMAVTGRGGMQHAIEIYGGVSARLLASVTVNSFETQKIAQEIEWSDISPEGEFSVSIKVMPVNSLSALASFNYAKLTWPRNAALQEGSFVVDESTGAQTLQLTGTASAARLFDISSPADIKELKLSSTSDPTAIIPSSTEGPALYIATEVSSTQVKAVTFTAIDPSSFNYIIITHPSLRQAGGLYADPVQAYADYRATAQGGGHLPLIAEIQQLYDQFSYGEQSPVSIYRFMKYMSAIKLPDYLFLIGKGLDMDYDYFRKPELSIAYKMLVPSAGMPGSDMAFTAGLDGNAYAPAVSTGRLSAMSSTQVAAYLDKVKETEARPFNDLRRKNILHLSGGIYPGEPQKFRNYLREMAMKAETYYLGGHVDAVAKMATDITRINVSKEVNAGVGLITFFGHSSTTTLDFDVGFVTDEVMGYRNKGKYPIMLVNGCYARNR
jgi:hypothetical protein